MNKENSDLCDPWQCNSAKMTLVGMIDDELPWKSIMQIINAIRIVSKRGENLLDVSKRDKESECIIIGGE